MAILADRARVTAAQWSDYREYARGLGFLEMAAAPAGPVSEEKAVRDWVEQGFAADMDWYGRSLDKRLDSRRVMADAASVIMLTMPYQREPCTLAGAKLARYACGDDYHDVLIKKLRLLCQRMAGDFDQAGFRPYVDTGPILERYWAREAGLGWIGKNGNLIDRRAGSYLFLAAILTNLTVPFGKRHEDYCGACRACIDACPTRAIVSEGVVDSRKCISYLNIEHRGPFDGAPDFDGWLFGCDICQEVCPWTQKFAPEAGDPALLPLEDYSQLEAADLREMEALTFSALFGNSAIKRTKLAGLKRNLAHLEGCG